MHGSCPVTKGEKYSATKWVGRSAFHQYLIMIASRFLFVLPSHLRPPRKLCECT